MENTRDANGQQLFAQFHSGNRTAESIEREDNYIDTGSQAGTNAGTAGRRTMFSWKLVYLEKVAVNEI